MGYTLSPEGVTFITTEESFEPKAYDKDGHWTIGFGHTGEDVLEGHGISRDAAVALFEQDVKSVLSAIDTYVRMPLKQCQVDAITSLLFNCGPGLLGTERSLGHALVFTKTEEAVGNAILLYDMATINGVRGPFLASRRKAEHEMFNGAEEVSTPSGTFKCAK